MQLLVKTVWGFLKDLKREDFPGGPMVKNLSASAGTTGLIPGLGRSHVPRDT